MPTTPRQSPFRRPNSASPAPSSPLNVASIPSSDKPATAIKRDSLSSEKQNPFFRCSTQIGRHPERPGFRLGGPSLSVSPALTTQRSKRPVVVSSDETPPLESSAHEPPAPEITAETTTTKDINQRYFPSEIDGTHHLAESSPSTTSHSRPEMSFARPTTTARPSGQSYIRPQAMANGANGLKHVPQPLLRSMRESFEVLDSANSGSVNSAAVRSMLEQMGQSSDTVALQAFFPPNAPSQLNLARYLDILAGPLSNISHADELNAAFEAFDVDDSGQIDIAELRHALLQTAPEPGEEMIRLSEREVDGILGEFASRRAFGSKGLNVAKTKGEVFRYRDFMSNISGGTMDAPQAEAIPT